MDKCGECGHKFPSWILSPLVTSRGNTSPVCGICALKLQNKVLGVNRTKFNGEVAENFRQEAIHILKSRGVL